MATPTADRFTADADVLDAIAARAVLKPLPDAVDDINTLLANPHTPAVALDRFERWVVEPKVGRHLGPEQWLLILRRIHGHPNNFYNRKAPTK